MSVSKIKLSKQSFVDDNLDINSKRLTNLADAVNPQDAVTKAQLDNATAGLYDLRGNYDASGNVFPSAGGSGTAGAIKKGDIWIISVAGVLGGSNIGIGDSVVALVDTPGQTASNWNLILSGTSLGYTAENTANKVSSWSGTTNNTNYPGEKLVKDSLDLKADSSALASYLLLSKLVTRETPSGLLNGSNTTYSLAFTLVAGTEHVYYNGMLLNAGSGNDYTISGQTITMLIPAPVSTDVILVTYIKS